MSNEIEALGALATAGLVASELDKPSVRRRLARERAAQEARWWRPKKASHVVEAHAEGACANCETVLIGDFCHACGQSAHVHRSIGHVLEEFLHGIWHFDSKSWRTLPLLAFRPGKLTWDYIHGKRARYVAPLALFLLSIFLMFFVFGFVGSPSLGSDTDALSSARAEVESAQRDIKRDETELARPTNDEADRRDALQDLAKDRKALAVAQAELRRIESLPEKDRKAKVTGGWKDELAADARSGKLDINTGFPEIDANITKALENPDFAIYRVQQKAYKLSFLLVPLSLPLLWLMFFWRRDVTIYDHTVFALYSLSFMSLLFILLALVGKVSDSLSAPALASAAGLLALTPPIHMFAQLKGAYRLSVPGALVRTFILTFGSVATLVAFFIIIVIAGLAD